jgi:hypothetical protein
LIKSDDNRLLYQFSTVQPAQPLTLASKTTVLENRWYHLVITKTDHEIAFYVSGTLENKLSLGNGRYPLTWSTPSTRFHLGASGSGQSPLHGWLDEVAFYNRSLPPEEVKRIYQRREFGPCKLQPESMVSGTIKLPDLR